MIIIKNFLNVLSYRERLIFISALIVLALSGTARLVLAIQESSEWTPVYGGRYREGIIGQPVAINPVISENQVDQDISRLLYSSLADITHDYEIKDNGRTYVVKLKEGLLWSNGQPLTSDDVIFTIETIQNPDTRSPLRKNWQGIVAERVSELRVNLSLPAPYAFMAQNFKRLPIIPAHIFGNIPAANLRLSAYNLEPVGSGPYQFAEFKKRKDGFISEYKLRVNENFYGQKPFIENFNFVFYENAETLFKDFLIRKIDGFGSLTPLDTEKPPRNAVVNQIPMPSYYAIFFNPNNNPLLKNNDFRRALEIGINKRKIVEEVLKNKAEVVNGPLGKLGKAEESAYNLEETRQILSSLKEENIEITLIVPKIDFLEKTAFMIKEDWLSAGISKVNILTLPLNDLLQEVIKANNKYEMLLFGNILENPLDLFPFWHSRERFYPGLNLSLYKNSKVDNLIEKVRQTEDLNEQKELARAAEKIIVDEKPAIFLYTIPYTYIHTSNLQGFAFPVQSESPSDEADSEQFIINPSDRFKNITDWYVSKARVIK